MISSIGPESVRRRAWGSISGVKSRRGGAMIRAIAAVWLIVGWAHVAAAHLPAPAVDRAEHLPEGLSASDWCSIRTAYEAHRHAAVALEGGYLARNPGQQWQTLFDGRGFLATPDAGGWSWGLELASMGREGAEDRVVAPSRVAADGNRVNYLWSEALTEWYINDPRGLEHGYTVHCRPEGGAGRLQITLATRGDLRPQVSGDGRGVSFVSDGGATAVNYGGLTVSDADGAAVPARFAPLGDGLSLIIDDGGARYPLTIDPIAQQAYLKASNPDVFDEFGYSIAASGDTVVVGAFGEGSNATGVNGNQANNSAPSSGAAYVFVRNGTTWSQQAYLKASNTDINDNFGIAVAVSGDTAVIGAWGEGSNATGVNGNQFDNSLPNSGAVYVFVRNGTNWSQQAYIKASNPASIDNYAYSLAVSGNTIVVGAYLEDSNATGVNGNQADNSASDSGAAYVYVRNGTTWTQQAYLKASNTGASDNFGYSVAVAGDTILVGATGEASNATGVNGNQSNNSADGSGAAYVFVRSGTVWAQQAYLKASNTQASDEFGYAVALEGDTALIGAVGESSIATGVNGNQADNSAARSGAAYVFVRNGTTWSQQAYLKASNTGANDNFGCALALSGNTALIGAIGEASNATGVNGNQADNSAAGSGAAYLFIRNDTTWIGLLYLKASNTGANDNFGIAVAMSTDTAIVGGHLEDSNAAGVNGNQADNSLNAAGAAYIFTISLGSNSNCPSDVNSDGQVDLSDLAQLLSQYGSLCP